MNGGVIGCAHCGKPRPLGSKICMSCGRSFERSISKPKNSHPFVGTVISGKWQIVRLIGSGVMGEVFEAENKQLRRMVAVKVARDVSTPEAANRLEREALLIGAVQHPNICDVYDVGRLPDGRAFVVLERLYGEPLSNVIRSMHKGSVALIADAFAQVLSGLHVAHGSMIIHRDLKPPNIFLVDRLGLPPLVKILDFGFAKDVTGIRTSTLEPEGHHPQGHRVGTLAFMAPEQLMGRPVDVRADLFAVGVMLYQALSGVHPFEAPSVAEIAANVLNANPPPLSSHRNDLSSLAEDVVARALAKDPNDRFDTAYSMQKALRRAFPSLVSTPSMAPPGASSKP